MSLFERDLVIYEPKIGLLQDNGRETHHRRGDFPLCIKVFADLVAG